MSCFIRAENEHKTVLAKWDKSSTNERQSSKSFLESKALEKAVIEDDVKQVKYLLSHGLAYVNEKDANGWTVLHLSCSYLLNKFRLEITKFLLEFPETDTTAKNNLGNTPLHYLVCLIIPPSADGDLYLQNVHQIIKDVKNIHIQNLEVIFSFLNCLLIVIYF